MTSPEESNNHQSNMKLSQLRNIMRQRPDDNADYIKAILQTGFDINCDIKSTRYLESKNASLIGCTALHLAFMEGSTVTKFLEFGADYTITNKETWNVLLKLLEMIYRLHIKDSGKETLDRLCGSIVTWILDAHYESENFTNPCTNYGLSHFHAACTANHATLVKSFIEHGVSVNQSVAMDATVFAGYSPLHFAVRAYAPETVKVLIDFGADIHLKNPEGKTPLHMLIEQKIDLSNPARAAYRGQYDEVNREEHEQVLQLFIQNKIDCDNISLFHVACTMRDSSILDSMLKNDVDINLSVPQDSPIWPGYTGLHFAALCNIENLILLLERRADIQIKNNAGETAFDLCQKKNKAKEICKILSSTKIWKDIVLSDNETTLLELVNAMENAEKLKAFFKSSPKRITAFVPSDSSLWPGYSALHIAILFDNFDDDCNDEDANYVAHTCLLAGADLIVQSADGSTALHLAFRQGIEWFIEKYLLVYCKAPNLEDNENLSILHIASTADVSYKFMRNLSQTLDDINVRYKGEPIRSYLKKGFTPLHVAVVSGNYEMAGMLLAFGADPYAVDSDGYTPIHWLFGSCNPNYVAAEFFLPNCDIKEYIVSGFSHLHIVSYPKLPYITRDLIEKLLKKPETNVNSVVHYDKEKSPPFLAKYSGATPLSLALQNKNWETAGLLVEFGADILMRRPNNSTPLYDALNSAENYVEVISFLLVLKKNKEVFRQVKEDTGLTSLHLACYMVDLKEIESLLKGGEDLNAQIFMDSPLWPGSTPLHILVRHKVDLAPIKNLLCRLELNFDATLPNADGNTGVHLAYKFELKDWINYLLEQLNSNKNPVSNDSISHFHVACAAMNFYAIDKFLQSGFIDINVCIDPFFDGKTAGLSPLHLALSSDCILNEGSAAIEIIDLLLKNGANVNAKDTLGETLLHKAVKLGKTKFYILKKIIEAGADVNAIDIFGVTAFELLLENGDFTEEQVEIFINHGCRFNAYNPIDEVGYASRIFVNHGIQSEAKRIFSRLMCFHLQTRNLDEKDRTIVHSLVSNKTTRLLPDDYIYLIERLVIVAECDIDDQDNKGRTALCLAAYHGNKNAIHGLLIAGADINITDKDENLAFDYLRPEISDKASIVIAKHVRKLEIMGLYASSKNKSFAEHTFLRESYEECHMKKVIKAEVELSKAVEIINPLLTLHDLLFEINTKATAALVRHADRISMFFYDFEDNLFEELRNVFKLQYRKALARPALIDNALVAFHNISGCPMECVEFILMYVINDDLKSLIEADKIKATIRLN